MAKHRRCIFEHDEIHCIRPQSPARLLQEIESLPPAFRSVEARAEHDGQIDVRAGPGARTRARSEEIDGSDVRIMGPFLPDSLDTLLDARRQGCSASMSWIVRCAAAESNQISTS